MAKKTKGRDAPNGKRGRPPYVPNDKDRTTVRIMVAGGIQYPFIAEALGISRKTLQIHYAHELKNAAAQANAQVVARLFKLTESNVRAQEFWLTNRDKKNWAHTQKVAVDQNVTTNLGERLARAQKQLKAKS